MFSILFGLRGPVWSLDFKIVSGQILLGIGMSQEDVVGAALKAKSEVSSTSPVLHPLDVNGENLND